MPVWLAAILEAIAKLVSWKVQKSEEQDSNIQKGKTDAQQGVDTGNDSKIVEGLSEIKDAKEK